MPALPELQESFARGLFGADREVAASLIGARGQGGEAGLAVYRNNVLANYRHALRDTYPVVLRLVGADCFDQAANAYARATPADSGDLYDFGAGFGDFLAAHPSTRRLAYLPDVARLEWAVERAERAPEAGPLDLARLAAAIDAHVADLGFVLHPSARLLASPWPVLKIWQVNQPTHAGDQSVDLGLGGDRLLVIRRDLTVQIERLDVAEYALLAALAAGSRLGDAFAAALAQDDAPVSGYGAGFDLNLFLRRHVQARTLVDFRIP